ncbi:MAG: hypothetical protein LBE86_01345 [Gemmobacter sp.]|jgi:hypothetical protein|nr:hypothetical protein [Gemmobacter sp.]
MNIDGDAAIRIQYGSRGTILRRIIVLKGGVTNEVIVFGAGGRTISVPVPVPVTIPITVSIAVTVTVTVTVTISGHLRSFLFCVEFS